MKRILGLVLLLTMVFSLVGCSQPSPPEADDRTDSNGEVVESDGDYFIGGGSSGGVYYAMSALFAQFFNDMGAPGQYTAYPTTGTGQNLAFMREGEIELAIIAAPIGADAIKGINDFEGNPYEDLTAITFLYGTYIQLFPGTGTGIESVHDIAGRRMAVGAPGGGDVFMLQKILAAYDMTFDDFEPEYVGAADGVELMRDGHVDVLPGFTNIPFSTMTELTNAGRAYLIGLDEDVIENLTTGDDAEFYPLTIPAGTYKGQADDIKTVGFPTLLCVDASVSEEHVYEMTKAIWENIDNLNSRHAAIAELKLEDIKNVRGAPLHPGAEKYYKEVGAIQ